MYYLERACQAQIGAMSGNAELLECAPAVAEKVALQFERPERVSRIRHWPAMLRLLDRIDPSYKQ